MSFQIPEFAVIFLTNPQMFAGIYPNFDKYFGNILSAMDMGFSSGRGK